LEYIARGGLLSAYKPQIVEGKIVRPTQPSIKEQEEAVKQANKEFNFYFLQDEYSQRKYQRNMETSLEKFLDLYVDDVSNDSFLLDATTDYLNNRFMEVI
jgi:hypothetical protein